MDKVLGIFRYFFSSLYHGIVFGLEEYDTKLQLTKTPTQRLLIWSVILLVAIVMVFVILSVFGKLIGTIVSNRLI